MATRTPASGFPVAFTAADETTIDSLFPSWLRTPGNATPNLAGYMRVLSNKATNKFGLPSECGYRIDGTFANDQYAGAVISGLAGTFDNILFRVRSSADVDAGRDEYRLRIRDTSPKQTYVEYVLNGSVSSTLGSYTDIAWVSGDTPIIEVEGSDIRVYNGATLLKTLTGVATALTAGNPGWSIDSGSGNLLQIDDLVVGNLSGGAFTLTSDQGSFSLTGQAATLKTARKVFADFGTYALTGQAATLQKDSPGAFTLTAEFGSYSWNGSDALADYAINAEYGVYNLSGQAATLTRFQPGSYSLTADFGSYALSGQVATFSRTLPQNYSLAANQGSYNFTGRAARLDWSGAPVVPSSGTGLYSGMRIGL